MSSASVTCEHVADDLSAVLDGELSAQRAAEVGTHLDTCSGCRSELEAIASVRRGLRTSPAVVVPDLVAPIMRRLPIEDEKRRARKEWRIRVRIALTAAAVAGVLLIGAWLPGRDDPPQAALAAVVVDEVRAEARALDTYRATFSIIERGWHENVDVRRFSAEVTYKAPQSFRLSVTDHTEYPPGDWPANGVELVANPRAWWISEPSTCPPSSLPGCMDAGTDREQRALVQRRPFDGTIGLPTDLILPLQTLSDSPGFEVEPDGRLLGRPTLHITLPFREALPLVSSLQTGGSWRTFYPSDRVDLWIDRVTGFPIGFEITADKTPERKAWARAQGYEDASHTSLPLLEVAATDFSEPEGFAPQTFSVPQLATEGRGGFERSTFTEVAGSFAPGTTMGLAPYRAGRSGAETILAYSEGMAWLKVTHDGSGNSTVDPAAEEVALGGGRWGYYRPATFRQGRAIELLDAKGRVHVESNLPREDLLTIAASIHVRAEKAPRSPGGALAVERVDFEELDDIGFVRIPSYLPQGYGPTAAFTSRSVDGSLTATAIFRSDGSEYDGLGIRITQSDDATLLPPSPEKAVHLSRGGIRMRWSPLRGEVDWLRDDVYTSISAPSFPRATLFAIAESLE